MTSFLNALQYTLREGSTVLFITQRRSFTILSAIGCLRNQFKLIIYVDHTWAVCADLTHS